MSADQAATLIRVSVTLEKPYPGTERDGLIVGAIHDSFFEKTG